MALFREVTGGLMSGKKEEPIEYQPRAPLVMPPSAGELPQPVETASTTTPEWPVSRDERIAAMQPDSDDPRYGGSQAEYRRLKPLAGVLPSAQRNDEDLASPYAIIHSKKQQQEFREAIAEAEGFGSANERRFLTDPPTEYRKPAASAPSEFDDIEGSGGGGWLRWLLGRGR